MRKSLMIILALLTATACFSGGATIWSSFKTAAARGCAGAIPPGAALFHYDVVVTGRRQATVTTTNVSGGWNGTETTTIDWTTTFKNLPFRKRTDSDGKLTVQESTPHYDSVTGTTNLKYRFEVTRPEGPCSGTVQLSLGTELHLTGSAGGSRAEFGLDVIVEPAGTPQFDGAVRQRITAACGKEHYDFGPERHIENFEPVVAVAQGLTFKTGIFRPRVMSAHRAEPKGSLFFPLKELANGEAFSFMSGEAKRSFTRANEFRVTTELKADFKPSR
jgi:hypothetical protein